MDHPKTYSSRYCKNLKIYLTPMSKKKSSRYDENLIFGDFKKNAFFHKVLSHVPKLL
jgi:hypothetical protein